MDIQNISIGADPNLLIEEGIYNIVNDATVHSNYPSITEGGVLIVKNGTNSKLTQTFLGSWGIYTRAGTFSTAWNTGDWVLNGAEESAGPSTAGELAYINTTSNLEAEDVQEAIDEIVASSFTPVVDTWHDLTLDEDFVGAGGSGTVKYRLNKIGQLELDVQIYTVGESPRVGQLPEGYRPAEIRFLDQAYAYTNTYNPFVVGATLDEYGYLHIVDRDLVSDGDYKKFLIVSLD